MGFLGSVYFSVAKTGADAGRNARSTLFCRTLAYLEVLGIRLSARICQITNKAMKKWAIFEGSRLICV
jgi:hypothetical protein